MAEQSGGIVWRTVRKAGAWLYGMAFRPGWPRWVFLGVLLVLFLLIVSIIRDGVDYRRDPSALVPRSATMYAETSDLPVLLRRMGEWQVWRERAVGSDQWNQLHVALAEMLGVKVSGLGTRLPLVWLAGAERAAYAVVAGDGVDGESWAIYLSSDDPDKALAEIRVESGLNLLRMPSGQGQDLYELTGAGDGALYLGVMRPWLIISSDNRLPVFAMDSLRSPQFSLAHSGLLPAWRRGALVRGICDPAVVSSRSGSGPLTTLSAWMKPEARWTFSGEVGADGIVDARFAGGALLRETGSGGLIIPLLKTLLFIIAVACLVFFLGTVSVMIGLGGWYKFLATRAGIVPKPTPAPVEPSAAFREDAGLDKADHLPVPAPDPQDALPVPVAESSASDTSESGSTSDVSNEDKISGFGINEEIKE